MEDNQIQVSKNPMEIFYIIFAIVLGVLMVVFNAKEAHLGFVSGVLGVVLSVVCSYIGIKIGDFLRKLAIPDTIWTTGGMWDILKTKLFWFIGPQSIGGLIGAAIGLAIVG